MLENFVTAMLFDAEPDSNGPALGSGKSLGSRAGSPPLDGNGASPSTDCSRDIAASSGRISCESDPEAAGAYDTPA